MGENRTVGSALFHTSKCIIHVSPYFVTAQYSYSRGFLFFSSVPTKAEALMRGRHMAALREGSHGQRHALTEKINQTAERL